MSTNDFYLLSLDVCFFISFTFHQKFIEFGSFLIFFFLGVPKNDRIYLWIIAFHRLLFFFFVKRRRRMCSVFLLLFYFFFDCVMHELKCWNSFVCRSDKRSIELNYFTAKRNKRIQYLSRIKKWKAIFLFITNIIALLCVRDRKKTNKPKKKPATNWNEFI